MKQKTVILNFGEMVNIFNVVLTHKKTESVIRVNDYATGNFIMTLPLHSLTFYFNSSIGFVYRLKEHSI